MATYTKVKTAGEVLSVPVSDFKPVDLAKEMTPLTEALITRNKEMLGVYMTVEHRNWLAERLEATQLALEMMMAGATADTVRRSASDAAQGRGHDRESAKARLKEIRASRTESR